MSHYHYYFTCKSQSYLFFQQTPGGWADQRLQRDAGGDGGGQGEGCFHQGHRQGQELIRQCNKWYVAISMARHDHLKLEK